MLLIFRFIVFGFVALAIVDCVLAGLGGLLSSLFSALGSSLQCPRFRRPTVQVHGVPAPETSCGRGPNARIATVTGSGGYCCDCEIERYSIAERMAKLDWEARKIELRRDYPHFPQL
jgi:hypothetical protein